MNNTIIKMDYDGKTAFISEESKSKRQVRAVVHLGQIYYCANDIAACAGYLAPHKVAVRFPAKYKIKLPVPWISKKRRGTTEAFCLRKEHLEKFLERISADDNLHDWLFDNVIPKAEENLITYEDGVESQSLQTDGMVAAYDDEVIELSKPEIAQVTLLIKSLDQIITDAVLLKNELSKSF